jgi:flagellar motor switch protein FliN/FliY
MGMSQEEIDRLMAQVNEDGSPASGPDQPSREEEVDLFQHIAHLYAEAIQNIVPILIGATKVVINTGQPLTGQLGDLVGSKQGNVVFFMAKEPNLTKAPVIGWMDNPTALQIAKRMMGQEEESELNEVMLSAVNEAFSNILGAFDASLKDEFKQPIENAGFKILEGDVSAAIQSEADLPMSSQICLASLKLRIEEFTGGMGLLTTLEGLDEMYSKHPLSSKKEAAPTAPSKTAAAAPEIPPPVPPASAGKATVPLKTKPPTPEVPLARFEELTPHRTAGESRGIDLILDVPLGVTVELGRKRLSVKEILELVPGSLVELDKLAGENVDLYVNGKLFAKGEVVVIDENFGVRVSSIVTPKERLERMR